jgi:large subunit ribosomal protein L18e
MTAANPLLRRASVMLERAGKKQDAPIWTEASALLSNPSRTKVEVNVGRIARLVENGDRVFVPGKVLGTGLLGKKVVVGAFAFSDGARSRIESSGGEALTVEQFLKKYPKGSGVKLVR